MTILQLKALDAAVDAFAEVMKAKLEDKYLQGYNGWDEEHEFEAQSTAIRNTLRSKLRSNYERDDWVDVANLAMMLWKRDQK